MPMIYKGTDPTTDIKLGTVDVNDVYLGDKLVWHRNTSPIPTGYTVKDYVESNWVSGGQFIKTNITLPHPKIVMDVVFKSFDGWMFFCGKWAGNSNAYNFGDDNTGSTGINFWSGSSRSDVVTGQALTTNTRYTVTMDTNRVSWTTEDNTGNGHIDNTNQSECTNTTQPILLFCMSVNWAWDYSVSDVGGFYIPVSAMANVKVYECVIYDDNDTELAHFIPCTRDSDNKVGFYNTVDSTFYSSYDPIHYGEFI